MRVLVTGANGFVGTHAVLRLLEAGHDVVAATLDGAPVAGARGARLDVRDQHVLLRLLESTRPDAILHLAGIAYLPDARRAPQVAFDTNATGTLNLLQALVETAPDARVVVVSSAEVYGPVALAPGERLREDLPLAPVTIYGASKAAAEHVARAYAREGVDVVVLRPFNHIGPGQSDRFVVSSFAHQVARLERARGAEPGVLYHGNLEAVRDFLDVRDIVRAYEVALSAPPGRLRAGDPYNLCSGTGTSIAALVEQLVRAARVPLRAEIDAERVRPVDVPELVGDPARFQQATGFRPQIPLARTIHDVLDAARAAVA